MVIAKETNLYFLAFIYVYFIFTYLHGTFMLTCLRIYILLISHFPIFCISVALNYQYLGLSMDLNRGRFLQNGRCGYVLKPAVLREGD